jgi:deoxyinosine 3'endonuclease (endonuclease V)
VDEMVDTHLINIALAGYGIAAAVAVLIAVSIIGIAAFRLRGTSHRAPAIAGRGHSLTGQHERIDAPARERQAA